MKTDNTKKILLVLFLLVITLIFISNVLAADIKETALRMNRIELLNGDANADNKVDLFDLALIGLNYGAEQNDESWNWKTDIANTEGKIDIFDLAEVGINYGKSYKNLNPGNNYLSINPNITSVYISKNFVINVEINAEDMIYATEFFLNFDKNFLRLESWEEGDFLNKDASTYIIPADIAKANQDGKIGFAATRLESSAGVNGIGNLARFNFTALINGTSDLILEDITLLDNNIEPLFVTSEDALVEIKNNNLKQGNNYFSLPKLASMSFNQLDTSCEVVEDDPNSTCDYDLAYYDSEIQDYVCLSLDDILEPGKGYAVKVSQDCYFDVTGGNEFYKEELVNIAGNLLAGWNLIGAASQSIRFSDIIGDCIIDSGPWGYEGNEEFVSLWLNPGKGYMIKVNSTCNLS